MPLCSQYLQYEWAKPQTTGSSVKFYQPWKLIVYSRIMLGNVRSCIFFSLGFVSFTPLLFARGTLKTKEHTQHRQFMKCFYFFLWWSSWFHLMSEPLRVPHIWLRLLWNTSFTHPHPCQPIKMFYRNHDLSEFFCKFDCCILLMQKK